MGVRRKSPLEPGSEVVLARHVDELKHLFSSLGQVSSTHGVQVTAQQQSNGQIQTDQAQIPLRRLSTTGKFLGSRLNGICAKGDVAAKSA